MKKLLNVICIMLFLTPAMAGADDLLYYQPSCYQVRDYDFSEGKLWVASVGSLVCWNEDGSYTQFTVQDGIPSNNMTSLCIDRYGYVWVGTSKGLAVYNGWSFKSYTTANSDIPGDIVADVAEDEDGNIWVTTDSGVGMFDGSGWMTKSKADFGISEAYQEIDIAPDNTIWFSKCHDDYNLNMAVYDDGEWTVHDRETLGISSVVASHTKLKARNSAFDSDGNLWIATHRGLLKYDGESWEYDQNYTLSSISVTPDDRIIAATSKGIQYFDDGEWNDHEDFVSVDDTNVFHARVRDDGSLWFVNFRASYWLESLKDSQTTRYVINGPKGYSTSAMLIDSRDDIWLSTVCGLYALRNGEWTEFSEEDIFGGPIGFVSGITINAWAHIFEDDNGALWFMGESYNPRIACFDGEEWNYWEYADINDEGILPGFAEKCAKDEFRLAERGHCYIYRDGVWEIIKPENNFVPWENAFDHNGVLWSSSGDNLASYENGEWTYYPEFGGEIEGLNMQIAIDPSNVKWINTTEGFYSYNDGEVTSFDYDTDRFCPRMNLMNVDQMGRLWTFNHRYFSINDGNGWVTYDLDEIQEPGWAGVFTMKDENELWISDVYGVRCYEIAAFPKVAPVSVEDISSKPIPFELTGNYPNPFNPSTTISYTLEKGGYTELSVFNTAGQKIRDLVASHMTPGTHSAVWNGRNNKNVPVSSGVYIIKLGQNDRVVGSRMTLVK